MCLSHSAIDVLLQCLIKLIWHCRSSSQSVTDLQNSAKQADDRCVHTFPVLQADWKRAGHVTSRAEQSKCRSGLGEWRRGLDLTADDTTVRWGYSCLQMNACLAML